MQSNPAAESLISYSIAQWKGFRVAPHHEKIADALERVERGECKRLMIFTPPRHGKSLLASQNFPAWYLGRNPDKYIISATYSQDLASDFGRKVRNQMLDPLHRAVFPACVLSEDSRSIERLATQKGGSYYAVGVGGAITGRGSHCFVAGTQITTNIGDFAIENLQYAPSSVKILSYNHERGQHEYKELEAFASRKGFGIYRVTTTSGRMVEVTGDHRIFTVNKGYTEASQLASGDTLLLSLREGVYEDGVRVQEANKKGAYGQLLFKDMFRGPSCDKEREKVPIMRGISQGKRPVRGCGLLFWLHTQANRAKAFISSDREALSDVQPGISCLLARKIKRQTRRFLQFVLQESGSFKKNVGQWKSQVERWGKSLAQATSFGQSISYHASSHQGEGQSFMPTMRNAWHTASCPPSKWTHDGQCGVKSCDTLPGMSLAPSCGNGFWERYESVAKIERICDEAIVYDIQVADNHNLFANGILAHNCLLIDDPLKGREDADSMTTREKMKDWYKSVAYTRLMPGGAIVVIMTRWQMDDLAGWLLKDHADEEWEVLSLAATDEDFSYALWEEDFPVEALKKIRRAIGPREWSALYMQRPVSEGGGDFRRDWIQYYKDVRNGVGMNRYILVDPASAKKRTSDYTAVMVVGLAADGNYYILDMYRDRMSLTHRGGLIMELHRKYKPRGVGYEEYGLQADIEYIKTLQEADNYRFPIVALGGSMKKEDRIKRLVPIFERGELYLPPTLHRTDHTGKMFDLVESFIEEEYLPFDAGAHDDMIDCLSRIVDERLDARFPKEGAMIIDNAKAQPYGQYRHEHGMWMV